MAGLLEFSAVADGTHVRTCVQGDIGKTYRSTCSTQRQGEVMLWERLLTARDPRKAEISAGTPYVARRVFAPVGAKKGYPRCCLSLTVVRFGPDEPLCVLNDLSYKARPGEWWESCGTRGMPLALWGEYAAFIADCDEEMRALRVAGKL